MPLKALNVDTTADSSTTRPFPLFSSLQRSMAYPLKNGRLAWVERLSMSTAILANAISTIERRVEGQEARILGLERELRQYQIDQIINGGLPLPRQPANAAPLSKPVQHRSKATCLATPPQEHQHPKTHPDSPSLSTSAPAPVPVSAKSSPQQPSDKPKAPVDAGEAMEAKKSKTPYHFEDLNAFESRLVAQPKDNSISVIAPPSRELPATLLEGIGSAEQITHHEKGPDSCVEICVEGDFSITNPPSKQKPDPSKFLEPRPWDGTIAWVTTAAFESADQEQKAVILQPPSSAGLGLFQHGLVFKPRDDENAYRTVLLTQLPLDVEMKSLLEAIRGGEVFEAHLMNTEVTAGYLIAIVTFVREKDAVAYAKFASKYGVYFNNQRVKVVLSPTPTYPISRSMEYNILRQGYTRCISISGESDPDRYTAVALHIMEELPIYFTSGDAIIENKEETEIIVRFNSVKAAAAAMASLRRFPLLSECDLDFAADPCSQPLPAKLSSGGN